MNEDTAVRDAGTSTGTSFNVSQGYRPDIDGLRAIAVLAVLAFHAFPTSAPAGFIGVDIFFVISGYLISGIIVSAQARRSFTYRDFYSRRIRRIFPALIVVIAACLLVGRGTLFVTEFTALARHAVAATAFGANILSWRDAGYFDVDSAFKPLLHLWSLGIEEQFYLVWPVVTWFLLRFAGRYLTLGMVALWAASFALNIAFLVDSPLAVFYFPVTRFWELISGALLAQLTIGRTALFSSPRWHPMREWLAVIGAAILGYALLTLNGLHFPGWKALLPVVATTLLIAAGPRARLNRALLSSRPLVLLGLVSYPLYLWHWPVLAFLRIHLGADLSPLLAGAALLFSLGLAVATYWLVERPFRFGEYPARKAVSLAGAMAAASLVALVAGRAGAADERDRYVQTFDTAPPAFQYIRDRRSEYRLGCDFFDLNTSSTRSELDPSCVRADRPRSVLLWGDSHAYHLAPGLSHSLPADVALLQVTTSACPPTFRPRQGQAPRCVKSAETARQVIAAYRPEVVILAQREDHLETDWLALATQIRDLGARSVILVGPTPKWSRDLPILIARQFPPQPYQWLAKGEVAADRSTDRRLHALAAATPGLAYVSLIDALCDDRRCRAILGPDPWQDLESFDYGHLTLSASRYVADHILLAPLNRALAAVALDPEHRSQNVRIGAAPAGSME